MPVNEVAAPAPAPKEPWWVETFTKLTNLALVVALGMFIKCGTGSFSQNMERSKLATQKSPFLAPSGRPVARKAL